MSGDSGGMNHGSPRGANSPFSWLACGRCPQRGCRSGCAYCRRACGGHRTHLPPHGHLLCLFSFSAHVSFTLRASFLSRDKGSSAPADRRFYCDLHSAGTSCSNTGRLSRRPKPAVRRSTIAAEGCSISSSPAPPGSPGPPLRLDPVINRVGAAAFHALKIHVVSRCAPVVEGISCGLGPLMPVLHPLADRFRSGVNCFLLLQFLFLFMIQNVKKHITAVIRNSPAPAPRAACRNHRQLKVKGTVSGQIYSCHDSSAQIPQDRAVPSRTGARIFRLAGDLDDFPD